MSWQPGHPGNLLHRYKLRLESHPHTILAPHFFRCLHEANVTNVKQSGQQLPESFLLLGSNSKCRECRGQSAELLRVVDLKSTTKSVLCF